MIPFLKDLGALDVVVGKILDANIFGESDESLVRQKEALSLLNDMFVPVDSSPAEDIEKGEEL